MAAVHAIERSRAYRETLTLEPAEAALADQDDRRLRRLALAMLVTAAGDSRGWNEERLARLYVYREDRSPLVAAAAQFTRPAAELSG
jgi:hypothetical protein